MMKIICQYLTKLILELYQIQKVIIQMNKMSKDIQLKIFQFIKVYKYQNNGKLTLIEYQMTLINKQCKNIQIIIKLKQIIVYVQDIILIKIKIQYQCTQQLKSKIYHIRGTIILNYKINMVKRQLLYMLKIVLYHHNIGDIIHRFRIIMD